MPRHHGIGKNSVEATDGNTFLIFILKNSELNGIATVLFLLIVMWKKMSTIINDCESVQIDTS